MLGEARTGEGGEGGGSDTVPPSAEDEANETPGEASCFPARSYTASQLVGDDLEVLRGVSVLHGTLELFSDSVDWTALQCLTRIDGDLLLGGEITHLGGLNRLTSIGGALQASGHELASIEGLGNLTEVGQLRLEGTAISELSGLDALTTASRVNMWGNRELRLAFFQHFQAGRQPQPGQRQRARPNSSMTFTFSAAMG